MFAFRPTFILTAVCSVILVAPVKSQDGKKLKIIIATANFSSMQTMVNLAKVLTERHHEVIVIAHDSVEEKARQANAQFISCGRGIINEEQRQMGRVVMTSDRPSKETLTKIAKLLIGVLREIKQKVMEYIKNNGKVDVVIGSVPVFIPVEREFDIPFISVLPTIAVAPVFRSAPYVPTKLPSDNTFLNQSFTTRLINTLIQVIYHNVVPYTVAYVLEILNPANRPTLTLAATSMGFDYPSEVPPSLKFVGPIITPLRSHLNSSIQKWLDEPDERPILYVSMGTVVELDTGQTSVFMKAFNTSKYRVLWALPETQWHGLPKNKNKENELIRFTDKNIMIVKWATTPAVLAHPKVKALFGHCGGNGTHESLAAGKPVIGLPFFGDQFSVCSRVEGSGSGIALPPFAYSGLSAEGVQTSFEPPYQDEYLGPSYIAAIYIMNLLGQLAKRTQPVTPLTHDILSKSIEEVLMNESYSQKAQTIRKLFKSDGGAESASDWIELVAQRDSRTLFTTPCDVNGEINCKNIDIWLVLGTACVLILSLFMMLLVCIRKCLSKKRKPKQKTHTM